MTFGWKVSKKLLEEVQNNQFSETINGDTKASVSKESEVEIIDRF